MSQLTTDEDRLRAFLPSAFGPSGPAFDLLLAAKHMLAASELSDKPIEAYANTDHAGNASTGTSVGHVDPSGAAGAVAPILGPLGAQAFILNEMHENGFGKLAASASQGNLSQLSPHITAALLQLDKLPAEWIIKLDVERAVLSSSSLDVHAPQSADVVQLHDWPERTFTGQLVASDRDDRSSASPSAALIGGVPNTRHLTGSDAGHNVTSGDLAGGGSDLTSIISGTTKFSTAPSSVTAAGSDRASQTVNSFHPIESMFGQSSVPSQILAGLVEHGAVNSTVTSTSTESTSSFSAFRYYPGSDGGYEHAENSGAQLFPSSSSDVVKTQVSDVSLALSPESDTASSHEAAAAPNAGPVAASPVIGNATSSSPAHDVSANHQMALSDASGLKTGLTGFDPHPSSAAFAGDGTVSIAGEHSPSGGASLQPGPGIDATLAKSGTIAVASDLSLHLTLSNPAAPTDTASPAPDAKIIPLPAASTSDSAAITSSSTSSSIVPHYVVTTAAEPASAHSDFERFSSDQENDGSHHLGTETSLMQPSGPVSVLADVLQSLPQVHTLMQGAPVENTDSAHANDVIYRAAGDVTYNGSSLTDINHEAEAARIYLSHHFGVTETESTSVFHTTNPVESDPTDPSVHVPGFDHPAPLPGLVEFHSDHLAESPNFHDVQIDFSHWHSQ